MIPMTLAEVAEVVGGRLHRADRHGADHRVGGVRLPRGRPRWIVRCAAAGTGGRARLRGLGARRRRGRGLAGRPVDVPAVLVGEPGADSELQFAAGLAALSRLAAEVVGRLPASRSSG